MKSPHEPREAPEASRVRIAHLDMMPLHPENCDRFPRGRARSLRQQDPQRRNFCLPRRSSDGAAPGGESWYGPERKCSISSAVMAWGSEYCPIGINAVNLKSDFAIYRDQSFRPWTAPLKVVCFNATTLWHSDAAEWAPSTASCATGLSSGKSGHGPSRSEVPDQRRQVYGAEESPSVTRMEGVPS
jgi:hypothetical protein